MVFEFFGPRPKAIIAMAHIGALPGSPLYDADGGMNKLIDGVASDIEKLQAGGVHSIMFGNENDRPYQLKAPAEGVAAMTAVIAAIKPMLTVPFGVNYLWDPVASIAIATATGASFAREIFTGLFASDMGLWEPKGAEALRLRRNLGRPDLTTSTPNSPPRSTPARSGCAPRARCSPRSPTPFWCPARSPASRPTPRTCARCARRCRRFPCSPTPACGWRMCATCSRWPMAA